jgi:hypothetical protein
LREVIVEMISGRVVFSGGGPFLGIRSAFKKKVRALREESPKVLVDRFVVDDLLS